MNMRLPRNIRLDLLTWLTDECAGTVKCMYHRPQPGDAVTPGCDESLEILQVLVDGRPCIVGNAMESDLIERLLDSPELAAALEQFEEE